MRIVIDEDGTVAEGSATLLGVMDERASVSPGGEIPDTSVAWRTFQCAECEKPFRARAGERFVHECVLR